MEQFTPTTNIPPPFLVASNSWFDVTFFAQNSLHTFVLHTK